MSVSAIILNPKSESESRFNVPVASEEYFRRVWTPVCKQLGLDLVGMFANGVEVTRADWVDVRSELMRLEEFASTNLSNVDATQVRARVHLLLEKLEVALVKDDLKVFIG